VAVKKTQVLYIAGDIKLKVSSTSYLHNRGEKMKELKQNDIQSVNGGFSIVDIFIDFIDAINGSGGIEHECLG